MFKEIASGFKKFFTRDKVIIFIVLFILGYALFAYSGSKGRVIDKMENGSGSTSVSSDSVPSAPITGPSTASANAGSSNVSPVSPASEYILSPLDNPSELLPIDKNSEWTALNPVTVGGNVNMPDLLQAGYHIGLDTIGQTLRNANLQLRSDPIIPKMETGPWLQSTIEPDLGRVPLELGYGCK